MSAVIQPDAAQILMKAYVNAYKALAVPSLQASKIIGVDPSTLSRKSNKGFAVDSKQAELQMHFIRLYRSLYALGGGDTEFMQHWFSTYNKVLKGTPNELCLKIDGLLKTNGYLDAMRGKV